MFGFARRADDSAPSAALVGSPAVLRPTPPPVAGYAVRRDLLQQISNFLLDHELDVNPANLALAQAAFSGRDARLNHHIAERQRANQQVTQAWLDSLAGDAIEHAVEPDEHSEQARAGAAIDHLTGLDNRREFEVVLDREYRAARSAGEALSIAFCDIDRFKLINDSHGHDTGDRVIQAIARVLQRVSDEHCHVARHGGEEFALLFRGLTAEQARQELDQARESFAQRKLVDRKTHKAVGSVTFSGGVADALAYDDPGAALKAADQALFQAKTQGRNRIMLARADA